MSILIPVGICNLTAVGSIGVAPGMNGTGGISTAGGGVTAGGGRTVSSCARRGKINGNKLRHRVTFINAEKKHFSELM
jgi:hypothetical protein